jgi:hypothetical protein
METGQKASSDLLSNGKLYTQRARLVLPYLVRQAKAGQSIYYSDLAQEVGIPNPRNLNYVLGAIGKAILELKEKTRIDIPPIQCIVINKTTNMPGEGIGWFINRTDYKKLSKNQKQQLLDRALGAIYSFQQWDWVLKQFQLIPIIADIKPEIERVKQMRGGGGESPFHLAFKLYVAKNPKVLGLSEKTDPGKIEYCLPSLDTIDVLFTDKTSKIGVEVKSRISDPDDILRGLFQCIKYKYLIEAEQKVRNEKVDCRVILALEGKLPVKLVSVKNILGVDVVDGINCTAI